MKITLEVTNAELLEITHCLTMRINFIKTGSTHYSPDDLRQMTDVYLSHLKSSKEIEVKSLSSDQMELVLFLEEKLTELLRQL